MTKLQYQRPAAAPQSATEMEANNPALPALHAASGSLCQPPAERHQATGKAESGVTHHQRLAAGFLLNLAGQRNGIALFQLRADLELPGLVAFEFL